MSIHKNHHFSISVQVFKGDQDQREAIDRLQGVCVFQTENEALERAARLQDLINRFVFPNDKQDGADHINGVILIVDKRDATPQSLAF